MLTEHGPAIRAAGGVVWRPAADGVEVCLVHRPRYGDWSLPKGKLEPGEHPLLAAVREVAEETDVVAVPQVRLPTARYRSEGLAKAVDYWSMRAVDIGGFQPETEVDEVRWLPVVEAVGLVDYPHDGEVLRAFGALPPVTGIITLVRHAHAGKRATWSGPDTARPLDGTGRIQARAIAGPVSVIRPVRLLSASPLRCVQTLHPVAELLDLPIEVARDLDEPEPGQQQDERALAAAALLSRLAATGAPAAVCSQGKVIPGALTALAAAAEGTGEPTTVARVDTRLAATNGNGFHTPKGRGWLLAFTGDRLLAADRL